MKERILYRILSFILSQCMRFENWSNVMKFRSSGDSTSSRVEDKLKTIEVGHCMGDRELRDSSL